MKTAILLKINSENDVNITSWLYWCKKNGIDCVPYKEKKEVNGIIKNYEKVGMVNPNIFIKWNSPNILDTFNDDICGVLDTSNFKKILDDIKLSKKELNVDFYLQTDVLFFNTKYVNILENTLENEQVSINYNINLINKTPKTLYPCWNLYSIHIKDMFKYNWQLNRDTIPSFIKYAYIWNFNDLPNEFKNQVINDVWSYVKNNYN